MIRRPLVAAVAALLVLAAAGCGGSSSSSGPSITIGAAKTYQLAQFRPAQPVAAGVPTRVSFQIRQPDGKPLSYGHHERDYRVPGFIAWGDPAAAKYAA